MNRVTWTGRINSALHESRRPFYRARENHENHATASSEIPSLSHFASTILRRRGPLHMADTLLTDLHVRYIQNLGKVS